MIKKILSMFAFLNTNGRIVSYFSYIVNIHSSNFLELNNSRLIWKEHVGNAPEFVRSNLQINPNIRVQTENFMPTDEIRIFHDVPLDLSLPTRARNKYQTDEHCPLSLSSTTQQVSHCIINTQQYLVKDSSSENEEIDVVAIDSNDSNNHSTLVVSDNGSNQIKQPILQDSALQNYFPSHTLKSNMSEEVNGSCSKSQYDHHHQNDYNITRSDNVSSSKDNLVHFIPFVGVITNAAQLNIRENDIVPRILQYQCVLPSETIPQQCSLNLLPIKQTVICNNIVAEDNIFLPVSKTVPDTTRSFINTNNDNGNPKRSCQRMSYESSVVKEILSEPPRKVYKPILPVIENNSNLVASTSQIIRMTTHKDINHTQNHLKTGHTFLSTYDVEENPRRCVITDVNTQQQPSNNTDFSPSLLKHVSSDGKRPISINNHLVTNNDEAFLKKNSDNSYNFCFYLNGIPFSWNFDRKNVLHLVFEISYDKINLTDIGSAEIIFKKSIKTLHWRHRIYSIPIFHTVDFVISNNIEYLSIKVSTLKYEINKKLNIYISQTNSKENPSLRLKCPRIHDFKKLINKLLETTFPIYSFPKESTFTYIHFSSLDYNLIEREITFKEYIEDLTRNPLNIKAKHKKKYNSFRISNIAKTKVRVKRRICWDSGLYIVYDIYKTFDINIKKILKILENDSKPLNFKLLKINSLLGQIIQKIKINCYIYYPKKNK